MWLATTPPPFSPEPRMRNQRPNLFPGYTPLLQSCGKSSTLHLDIQHSETFLPALYHNGAPPGDGVTGRFLPLQNLESLPPHAVSYFEK